MIRLEHSPLDYHGDHPDRFAIYEKGAGIDVGNSYFKVANLIAFLDWSPEGDGAFIHYMSTRPSHVDRGLARELVQHLYNHVAGEINWGHIMSDRAEKLWRNFRDMYPDRSRGKVR